MKQFRHPDGSAVNGRAGHAGVRLWLAALAGVALVGAGGALAAEPAGVAQYKREIQPLLAKYCYDCHGDGASKGNLSLDTFKSDAEALESHAVWLQVLKNLRAGLMPPEKKAKPTAEELATIESWIKREAFHIDAKNPDPGRATVRRLNRVEYRNTINDLMGYDFNSEVEFPPDDSGHGFDNLADALTVSPLLLEKYIQAASEIVTKAVPTVSRVVQTNGLSGGSFESEVGTASGERMSFYKDSTVTAKFKAKEPGTYRVTLDLGVRGAFDFDPGRAEVSFQINGQEKFKQEYGWGESRKLENRAGDHQWVETWSPGEQTFTVSVKPLVPADQKRNALDLRVTSLHIEGPLEKERWIKPKNYERFFPRDLPPETLAEKDVYAREIFQDFATRAFRRPADESTVKRLVAIAHGVYEQPGKTFEEGVGRAMIGVIASPRFLFRTEGPSIARAGEKYPLVDEFALATRLSYFFWSTMPDKELYGLAVQGKLRENLGAQVSRLLKDERVDSMVRNFTGQWLQARDVEFVPINARVILKTRESRRPDGSRVEFDSELRRAMRKETEMSFAYLLREDRSVLELLDSDYAFLNSRLADHYGIEGVKGGQFRKVMLPKESPRGGLLTQGTVLTVTSNPTRTSPVKRGLFILDNILGTPTPPPPPDVPELEEARKEFKDREPTVREMMEIHRSKPLCHSCHSRMDPLGMALENFNALGIYREKEEDQDIDGAGKLVTGEKFANIRELKTALKENRRMDFYRCLTEKLMIYALGRGLEEYDVETVDQIVNRLEKSGGKMSELVNGIVDSAPFQKQREGM